MQSSHSRLIIDISQGSPPQCKAFIERYESLRQRAWPEIEGFFQGLPPNLVELGWGFAQRLARHTSPSTEFRDALKHPAAARVVYLPLWLIEAYRRQGISIPHVDELQTHMFVSSFLGFCAIRIHDDLIDEDKPETLVDELLLANLLTVEATRHLQHLFASASPLWDHHGRHWREYCQAVYRDKQRDRGGLAAFTAEDVTQIGNKAALLKTCCVGVALYADRANQVDQIEAMVAPLNIAIQIDNDIHSLSDDIVVEHFTLPLSCAALAAGYAPGTHPRKDELMGSLLVSPAARVNADALASLGAKVNSADLQELAHIFPHPADSGILGTKQMNEVQGILKKKRTDIKVEGTDWTAWQSAATVKQIGSLLTSVRELRGIPPKASSKSTAILVSNAKT